MSTPHTPSQPGAGTPIPSDVRAKMRGAISRRFARVYLEDLRLLHVWRYDGGEEALRAYVKMLRRCDRLQAMERSLA